MIIPFVLRDMSGVIPHRIENGMDAAEISNLLEVEFEKLSDLLNVNGEMLDLPLDSPVQIVFWEHDGSWGVLATEQGRETSPHQGFSTQIAISEDVLRAVPWIWFEFRYFGTHSKLDELVQNSL